MVKRQQPGRYCEEDGFRTSLLLKTVPVFKEQWELSTGFAVLLILILRLQLVASRTASLASSQLSAMSPDLMGIRAKLIPLLRFLKDRPAS